MKKILWLPVVILFFLFFPLILLREMLNDEKVEK